MCWILTKRLRIGWKGRLVNLQRYQPLFPLVYLVVAAGIAIVCKYTGVDDTTMGLLVGAALTRVKVPKLDK